MERSTRNFQPSSSNGNFYALFASPNRYFTENTRWVPLVVARCEIYTGGFVCEVRVLGFSSPVEVPVLVCLPTSLVFHWFVAFIISDRS